MGEGHDTADQAIALAREAVKAGLTDKATAMRLVQDYAAAPSGPFGQVLVARGVVDQDGLRRLQAAASSAAAATTASSPSMWFPAGSQRPPSDVGGTARYGRPPSDARSPSDARPPSDGRDPHASQRLRPRPDAAQAAEAGATAASGSQRWVPPKVEDSPHGLSERTLSFDPVLKHPGESGSREFDPILAGAEKPRLDSTASSSRDLPQAGLSGEIRLDSVQIEGSGELLPQKQPQPGDKLGEYELKEILGSGGMGVIFEARRPGSDKRFAIKVLLAKQGPAGEARRQRFAREIEVLRRLEHPNIVRIHEAGRHGAYDWYAMDAIEGRELGDLLVQGRLTIKQKLDMFIAICNGVAHAHERGVVHRDLKPGNVLVTPTDGIHVLDFGLAKVLTASEGGDDLRLTHDGSSLGTPYYMAPEQLVSPKDVDARTDIFALGVLFYEILTCVRPFMGATAVDVSNKILNATPAPPSTLVKDLPKALDGVCLKALEKEPASRYQDVGTMRAAVEAVAKTLAPKEKIARSAEDAGGGDVQVALEWLSRNRDGVIVGFVLATLFWVPLLIGIVILVRIAR